MESKSEVKDSHKRELGGWWNRGICNKADDDVHPRFTGDLEAYICVDDLLTAKVKAEETGAGKATWTIDIESINPGICPDDDLNWHIHTKRVATDGTDASDDNCGGGQTSGHWDPGLACGGASEFAKTTCKGLDADYISSYGTRCSKDAGVNAAGDVVGQKGCEYGDLSGKMGQIEKRTGTQHFEDEYIQPLETYKYTSIVLHCGSPRKACADFQFH